MKNEHRKKKTRVEVFEFQAESTEEEKEV